MLGSFDWKPLFSDKNNKNSLEINKKKSQDYGNHLKNLANTEISYLHIASTGNQEIVWFDITMNNVLCIRKKKIQCLNQAGKHTAHCIALKNRWSEIHAYNM